MRLGNKRRKEKLPSFAPKKKKNLVQKFFLYIWFALGVWSQVEFILDKLEKVINYIIARFF